jgi:hypothetical protein
LFGTLRSEVPNMVYIIDDLGFRVHGRVILLYGLGLTERSINA